MLGVWATPGAPETLPKEETLPKGGGLRPSPFARVPGAAQTPKMIDFRSLKNFESIVQRSRDAEGVNGEPQLRIDIIMKTYFQGPRKNRLVI